MCGLYAGREIGDGSKMLPDVGMVQMYLKSANVNDLVLCEQAGPPLCMDQPSSLFLRFFRQVACHALQRHTAPSLHLPLFLEETFLHTLL